MAAESVYSKTHYEYNGELLPTWYHDTIKMEAQRRLGLVETHSGVNVFSEEGYAWSVSAAKRRYQVDVYELRRNADDELTEEEIETRIAEMTRVHEGLLAMYAEQQIDIAKAGEELKVTE